MPRGKSVPKREILPDPKYGNLLVAKFTNFIMSCGKKNTAQRVVYGALEILAAKKQGNALELFERLLETVRPQVEVRSRRVGGANYQVPMPVSGSRQNAMAFRWIITAARARKGHTMQEKLAGEFMDILEGVGGTIKKKEDVHRMAESNKAFAHFARFNRK
ncbi:MAG: 30S ribosomal protein S7 [Candidatus Magasanikbacteria bacterium RIFCSPHIGHO2_01_FULL_41_23]|uniref:Small ribosomal subunit protein uS7 n=1 Tax=Candidatus Magasanikbacteria bacterium RIFCSPLOWO2_01_FULL_40_15 TaxID=1798686 RepID=A0A1F6N576_9BACT|nr:MAG: 30S ribosomal protein S7 [Candidatus Magasanikbacteria bacterium RIFCSPHIGHO2_01_FULL_41_23]OGH66801.1 MAG: 30S ribosomal protein S7 [Candidatus Magasanikbacteria bacterium RIFCSPHIGHO2_02_FULL_41_35]OGH76679.1 MAG: 30S ribosomal protein S7 [Candidatus Magasanikbacteria bacterium RIFCSPHIGHO2_12_FULL_41_16]OGH78888.1 MAG: 30S ribosomal protein S7 [Candidatus Magasanikbacteria bacterium RIFCSPLOWO2_01_FULL_40_15]